MGATPQSVLNGMGDHRVPIANPDFCYEFNPEVIDYNRVRAELQRWHRERGDPARVPAHRGPA